VLFENKRGEKMRELREEKMIERREEKMIEQGAIWAFFSSHSASSCCYVFRE